MSESRNGSASKVLAMLEAVGESEGRTVAEHARLLGRDKSIISRQLRQLVELGLVERDEAGRHRLGWRLFTLAARAGDQRLLLLAPAVLRRLSDLTNERVHLNVLHRQQVLTILSESSRRVIEAAGWVGRTTPVHSTSAGRALLLDHSADAIRDLIAEVPLPGPGPAAPDSVDELVRRVGAARRVGLALVDGEHDADAVGAAAPVRDFNGQIVAAINVSAPAYRMRDQLSSVGRQVAAAATHLSKAISSTPHTPS